jgi:hypothetical protein
MTNFRVIVYCSFFGSCIIHSGFATDQRQHCFQDIDSTLYQTESDSTNLTQVLALLDELHKCACSEQQYAAEEQRYADKIALEVDRMKLLVTQQDELHLFPICHTPI